MKTSLRPATTSSPQRRQRPYPKARPSGQHPRRQFLRLAVGAAAFPAVSPVAMAQTYPSRPITMIVSAPAGGTLDAVARILTERMRYSLKQPIIINNVGGADGSIGAGRVARATPDGYTIDIGHLGNHVLNGAVYSLTYDVLSDFAPIVPAVTFPSMLVARKTMSAKDLNELIAWLKANPNKVSAGVATVGDRIRLALFQKEAGTQLILVPYRGIAPARQDLVAGQIDLLIDPPDDLPLVRAGGIKAFAVSGDARLETASDIPTFREMGLPALSWSAWYGLFAPRGTSSDVIGRLNAAAVEALADSAVRSRLTGLGFEFFPRERQTPEALGALVKADAERTWPIIKAAGIKPA
jgi:tripartite-type tricarboxylate transporter receptor subunit TctC